MKRYCVDHRWICTLLGSDNSWMQVRLNAFHKRTWYLCGFSRFLPSNSQYSFPHGICLSLLAVFNRIGKERAQPAHSQSLSTTKHGRQMVCSTHCIYNGM